MLSAADCDGVDIPIITRGHVWEVSSFSEYTTYTDDVTSTERIFPTPAPSGGATRVPNARSLGSTSLHNSGSLNIEYSFQFTTLAAATGAVGAVNQAALQAVAIATALSLPVTAYAPFFTLEKRAAIVAVAEALTVLAPMTTDGGSSASPSNHNLLYLCVFCGGGEEEGGMW